MTLKSTTDIPTTTANGLHKASTRKRYSSSVRAKALQMWKDGNSAPAIKEELGVSPASLVAWRKEAGIKKAAAPLFKPDELNVSATYDKTTTELFRLQTELKEAQDNFHTAMKAVALLAKLSGDARVSKS